LLFIKISCIAVDTGADSNDAGNYEKEVFVCLLEVKIIIVR